MASSKKPKYPVETPEESKISLTELANNPESRTPIIVCVDCSYSMLQNGRLYKMMEGLERFRRELENDPIAADSVELCIVSYGGTSAGSKFRNCTPTVKRRLPTPCSPHIPFCSGVSSGTTRSVSAITVHGSS